MCLSFYNVNPFLSHKLWQIMTPQQSTFSYHRGRSLFAFTYPLTQLCCVSTLPCAAAHSRMIHHAHDVERATEKQVTLTSRFSLNRNTTMLCNNLKTKMTSLTSYQAARGRIALSLVKRGGHIGHNATSTLQPRLRHPLSSHYLLGKRGKGDVMCPFLSADQATRGLYLVAKVLQRGGSVLLIDTRGDASPLQRFVEGQTSSLPSQLSFVGQHWAGGTLTNWSNISKTVRRCAQISGRFDNFLSDNRLHLPRYEKMRKSYLGLLQTSVISKDFQDFQQNKETRNTYPSFDEPLKNDRVKGAKGDTQQSCVMGSVKLTSHPDLLVVINPAENRHIIKESQRLGIPVVAVVDSNDTLHGITVAVAINPGSLLWPDSFAIRAVQLAIAVECKGRY